MFSTFIKNPSKNPKNVYKKCYLTIQFGIKVYRRKNQESIDIMSNSFMATTQGRQSLDSMIRGMQEIRAAAIRAFRDGDISASKTNWVSYANYTKTFAKEYSKMSIEDRRKVCIYIGEFYLDSAMGFAMSGNYPAALSSLNAAISSYRNEAKENSDKNNVEEYASAECMEFAARIRKNIKPKIKRAQVSMAKVGYLSDKNFQKIGERMLCAFEQVYRP